MFTQGAWAEDIVHDAEYYVPKAQNGKSWAAEDKALDNKLAELRKKHGTPPNIIHVMWDDTSYGDVGIPQISKIRGFETPNINRMAEEGIMFTRIYTEVGCTPSRAAVLTGRHAVRSGMYVIGLKNEMLQPNPYQLDKTFSPTGFVGYVEGKKGEQGREWRGTAKEDYDAFDPETKVRSMNFIRMVARRDRTGPVGWRHDSRSRPLHNICPVGRSHG
jgi:hypothetical protein